MIIKSICLFLEQNRTVQRQKKKAFLHYTASYTEFQFTLPPGENKKEKLRTNVSK